MKPRRESKDLTSAILDSTIDMIWSVDPQDFRLLTFNRSLSDYYLQYRGIRLKRGMRQEDLFADQKHLDLWRGLYQRALSERSFTTEYTVSAGTHTLHLTFNLLDRKGKVFGISVFGRDITERERAEEALHQEKAFTESILDSLPDSFFIIDSAGRYVRWNRNAGKALGYSGEEFASMDALAHVVEDERTLLASKMLEAFTKGNAAVDCHLVAKEGRSVPYFLTATRAIINNKTYLIGIGVDITERKQTEEALALLKHSIDVHFDGAYWTDSENRFIYINDAGCKSLGYKREELIGRSILEVNPHASPQGLDGVWDTLRCQGFFTTESVHRRKDGSEFPVEIVSTYVQFGGKEFNCGFARDIAARKRAEEALIEERHLLLTLMDNLPDKIYFKDRESRFTRINSALAADFGLSDASEAVGKTDFDYYQAEHAQEAFNDEQEIIQTGKPLVDQEEREIWPDGQVTWVSTTKMPLRDAEENVIGTFGISRDITERKQGDEALSESEGKYRALVSNIPDVIWTLDANLRFVFISRNIARMSGFSEEEVHQHGPDLYMASLHPDDVFKVTDGLGALFTEGRPYDVECRVRRKDGDWIWVHDRAVATYEKNGIRYADGLLSDISERKRAESALRESETLLNETGRLAKVGGWELNLLTHQLTWTKEVFRIHQVDDSFVPTLERAIGFYTPDSKPVIERAVERAMDHGEAFDLELEIVTARGKRLSVRAIGGRRKRNDDTVVVAGIFQDITELNRTESQLRASEVRYRRLFEASKDGILILDADSGEIRDVNPFLANLLGLDQNEILGRKLWEIGPLRDVLLSKVSFEELQTRGYVRCEDLPLETRDGRQIAVEFVSNVYLAGHQRVIQCNIRDITARREAEKEHVRLVTAIEQSAEAVVITTPAGDIEYVNPAFTRITGYSREEVLGKNPRMLKSGKQDPAFYKQLWETILNGKGWEGEIVNRREDGSIYTEHMSITPVRDEGGKVSHFIATKQDITERLSLEAHLHQASKMQAVGQLV